MLVYEFVFALL